MRDINNPQARLARRQLIAGVSAPLVLGAREAPVSPPKATPGSNVVQLFPSVARG